MPGRSEGVRFQSFFGSGVVVGLTGYHKMAEYDLLLKGLGFEHYRWIPTFMLV